MMGGLMTTKKIVDIFKPIEDLVTHSPIIDLPVLKRNFSNKEVNPDSQEVLNDTTLEEDEVKKEELE